MTRSLKTSKLSLMKNTTTTTTRFDHSLYGLSDEDLKKKLTNRVVTYFNSDESSVKNDGVRQFVIKSIDYTGHAKGSGRRYIQGEVQDLDDGGKSKSKDKGPPPAASKPMMHECPLVPLREHPIHGYKGLDASSVRKTAENWRTLRLACCVWLSGDEVRFGLGA